MAGFIINPSRFAAVGGGDGSLGDIVASNLMDLDATQSDSYGGSGQTWANLNTAPADSSGQTEWDAWLGVDGSASADDPAFVGTAGTTGAHFLLDGGDHFLMKSLPTFLSKIHRSSGANAFTIIFAGDLIDTSHRLFGNNSAATTDQGFNVLVATATGRVNVGVSNGSAQDNTSDFMPSDTLTGTLQDAVLAMKLDYNSPANTSLNGHSKNGAAFTGDAVDGLTTTTDSTDPFALWARNGGSGITNIAPNTIKVRAISIFSGGLSDAELSDIYDEYNTRHGSVYP